MSSAQIERPLKDENSEERNVSKNKSRFKENEKSHKRTNSNSAGHFPKKHKHENDGRNFKFGRKRSQSFSTGGGKFFPPYKRRKKEGTIIPPTKFLLGGNIYDPLNLNSLQDEEINRAMNAVTPKSSPLPTPRHRKGEIEVIIPPNLRDPLNLISCEDDAEYEQQLVSPTKRGRKSRNRKKKRNSSSGGSTKEEGAEIAAILTNIEATKASDDEKETGANVTVAEPVSGSIPPQENSARKDLSLDFSFKDKEQKTRKAVEDSSGGKDKAEKKRKADLKDKIVSPVIPQPGAWKRPPQYGHRGGGNMGRGGNGAAADGRFNRFRPGGNWQNKKNQRSQAVPNFKEKDAYFQYGNYLRYYGYRNPQREEDVRLKFFARRKDLFHDRDVLDIGCNIGHVTLIIARDFGARSVVGLDIDRKLIGIARKNVRHYINCADSPPNNDTSGNGEQDSKFFPISMPILYGAVDIPGISHGQSPSASKKFPHNVTFVQGNYVLDSDTLLGTEQPQFDVILCLSVTKWVHLNWGDTGLKQAFKRMYLQLRPGGYLILEAQAWESYKKKKNLTETIFNNYHSIEFFPHKFTEYLLSSEVGFTKCEVIGTPYHHSKGFQRPIQLFTKGTSRTPVSWSSSRETEYPAGQSSTNTPSHLIVPKASRSPKYTGVIMSSRETDDDDIERSNTNTPSHSVASGMSQTPVYTDVRMSTRETDDDYAGESNTNTPSHVIESGMSRPPVYTAVSMSVRETDDDEAGGQSYRSTPSHGIESGDSRPPVYSAVREADDYEAEAHSNINTPSHTIEVDTSQTPVYAAATGETDNDDAGVENNVNTATITDTPQAANGCTRENDDMEVENNANIPSHVRGSGTSRDSAVDMSSRKTDDDITGPSSHEKKEKSAISAIEQTHVLKEKEEKNTNLGGSLAEIQKDLIVRKDNILNDDKQNAESERDDSNVSANANSQENVIEKQNMKHDNQLNEDCGVPSTVCNSLHKAVERNENISELVPSDMLLDESDVLEGNSGNVHLNVSVEKAVPENMSSDVEATGQGETGNEKLHEDDGDLSINRDHSSNET